MPQTYLSREQLQDHAEGILKTVLRELPDIIHTMHPALEQYVVTGTVSTGPDRREAIRCLFNFHWKNVLGNPYNGHAMKHYYEANQDVPDLEEPTA